MTEPAASGPPSWLPASVGSAYRHGLGTDDDLVSGRAWADLLEALGRTGSVVSSDRAPAAAADQAAGYRHLLVLLALAIDEALRPSDPYDPFFAPANVDNVLKWGMDCPDAAYTGAAIRRGRHLPRSAAAATGPLPRLPGHVGHRELRQRRGRRPRHRTPTATSRSSCRPNRAPGQLDGPARGDLVARRPAVLLRLGHRGAGATSRSSASTPPPDRRPAPPTPCSAAGVGRQLRALGDFVEASVAFWLDVEEGGRAQGVNFFRQPAALTGMGAAAENVSVWGSWELDDDEALLIEVTPPEALYWSVSLGQLLVGDHRLRQPPVEL